MILLTPVKRLLDTIALLPEVARAVLVLPTLAEQLEQVRRNTECLPELVEQLERVQGDTSVLPQMRGDTADMRSDTARLAAVAVPLQGAALRLGRFSRQRGVNSRNA